MRMLSLVKEGIVMTLSNCWKCQHGSFFSSWQWHKLQLHQFFIAVSTVIMVIDLFYSVSLGEQVIMVIDLFYCWFPSWWLSRWPSAFEPVEVRIEPRSSWVGLDRGGRGEPELYLTVPLPIYPHRSPRYSILPKDEKYEECIHLVVLAMMTNEVMRQL